jgi:flagellin FlaB
MRRNGMLNRLIKAVSGINREEAGTNGLDTAIILIAFVTVAAVFGYAVLSAGLYSAERGKETIYAGLSEAKSNIELSGSVIALGTPTYMFNGNPVEGVVNSVKFTVKNAIAGVPIDMTPNGGATEGHNKCVISLTTAEWYDNNVTWNYEPIGADNGNNLLETGEQFEITIDFGNLGVDSHLDPFMNPDLHANDTFTIQVKPAVGSSITIERNLPPAIDNVMDLH